MLTVDCRFEFQLPGGDHRRAEARLDPQCRLDSGSARPEDVVVFHAFRTEHVLLVRSFQRAFEIRATGQWQFSRPPEERDHLAAGSVVWIAPSGESRHRAR